MATKDTSTNPLLDGTDLARLGNGCNGELSREQVTVIRQLFEAVQPWREKLPSRKADFCDLETCRRYLVARQWNMKKAQVQLESTLQYYCEQPEDTPQEFWQSPTALQNPLALSMRIVGLDKEGRPICYTSFAEAHDYQRSPYGTTHGSLY